MKPSAKIIYEALMRGEKLTPVSSLMQYGVHALSQRIGEIKKQTGADIVSVRVKGDVYHEYYLRGDQNEH